MRISLTTRLTAFFLAALLLVLAGFSLALFVLARSYLYRQADDRLEAAVRTLVATVEFHRSALEWEPNERLVTLGEGTETDQVRWLVRNDSGAVVARSRNLEADDDLVPWLGAGRKTSRSGPRARGFAVIPGESSSAAWPSPGARNHDGSLSRRTCTACSS